MARVPPHDWRRLDDVRGMDARQVTHRLRRNRWEVRDDSGRVASLDDAAFDRLRADREWLPEGLR
jgi:hypothetical protein